MLFLRNFTNIYTYNDGIIFSLYMSDYVNTCHNECPDSSHEYDNIDLYVITVNACIEY